MRTSHALAAAAVVALAALTGCGGDDLATTTASSGSTTVAAASTTVAAASAAASIVPKGAVANIINPAGTITARVEPAADGKIVAQVPGRTTYKTPLVLAVDDRQSGWLHVTLPTRPNGSTGWVEAQYFQLAEVRDTITVDLSDRKITLTVGGKTHTGLVTIGSSKYPTPTTGKKPAYITDNINLSKNPTGGYGTYALGVSLHSEVLQEFGTGDGQVGIHGTNEPSSIGQPVSHGCIRVPKSLEPVLAQVRTGTRVTIQP
jgi:lipoprotein-anchoring transpeptidase ErfK/SrfK